jgi:hypothetical protein
MITPNDTNYKNNWRDRLKTADNAYISELAHNFGLAGSPSIKDLPWLALTGFGAAVGVAKHNERKDRKQENANNVDDNKNVDNFSSDMSKMRDIVDQRKTNKAPAHNHPSVPGFTPDARSPYGVFDYESNGYTGGPPPSSGSVTDISEHPKFNSSDQGRSQRGRPFDREEE